MIGENISKAYLLDREFKEDDHGQFISYTKELSETVDLEIYSNGDILLNDNNECVELSKTHTTQKQLDLLILSFKNTDEV